MLPKKASEKFILSQGSRYNRPRQKRSVIILRLWKYLYRYKWLLATVFILTLVSNASALVGPLLSGYAINAIEPGKGEVIFKDVIFYAILMAVFTLLSVILNYIISVLMIRLSRNVVYSMRKDIFNKLVTLPVSFFDTHQTGDIISIISYDVDTVNTSLSNDVIQICTSLFTVLGSLAMMLYISPALTSVFALTIPMSILFTRYLTKRTRPLFRRRSASLGELNGYVEESVGGQKTVKAYAREEFMTERFDEKNLEAVEAYYQADYMGSVMGPSVNFISNLSLAFISILGAILYMNGRLVLGSISSFVLYSRKFSGPINEMANIYTELQSALAAAERVFDLMDEQPEPNDSPDMTALDSVRGNITFKNVSFGYDKSKIILNNLSLDVKEGSVVAIVGPTGAGKTTIINLLMRFYDIGVGSICIDGRNISESITRASLRAAFSMVLQDTWLFHGTIFENISYGKDGATLDEVKAAARAAKIDSYIESLPDGYNTVLSDNGINISKGQKQLLTIARAMLMDSKILILDEATSNVDTQTEERIRDAMLSLMHGRTCFVIAHRLSTIKNADVILVLRDGDIIEQGTHTELMNANGFYRDMYNSQFDTF